MPTKRDLVYSVRAENARFRRDMGQVNRSFEETRRTAEGSMRRVSMASRKASTDMQRDFTRANSVVIGQFRQMRGLASGALAGLGVGIGGLGVSGLVSSITKAASAVASLGDQADKIGVTVEQLQALRIEFEKSGVETASLDASLQRFSRRVGEAARGTGTLAKDFERLGINVTDANGNMRPLLTIMSEYAQAIKNASDRQEAGRLTFVAFGREGLKMVNLLADAGSELQTIASRFDSGIGALTSDDVRAAREIDAAYSELSRTLDVKLKKVLLPVGSGFLHIAESIEAAIGAANEFAGSLDRAGNSFGPVGKFLVKLNRWEFHKELLNSSSDFVLGILDGGVEQNPFDKLEQDAEKLTQETLRLNKGLQEAQASGDKIEIDYFEHQLKRVREELRNIDAAVDRLSSRGGGLTVGLLPSQPATAAAPGLNVQGSTSGLDPNFKAALDGLAAAAKGAGHEITVFSGFRSVERQTELWESALKRYGSAERARKWVAPPGRSNHNFGIAADLRYSSDAARQFAHARAGDFGLHFPMSWEPWHIEPQGPGGGRIIGANGIPRPADRREIVARREQESAEQERQRLDLLKQENVERERKKAAIDAVNESLARELELAGLEQELLESGKLTLEEVNAALDQESLVREKLNTLEQAGVEITDALEQSIRAKIAALYESSAAAEEARASQERLQTQAGATQQAFQSVGQPILDTLFSIVDGSQSAEDALKNLAKQLAQMLIQAALFGQGPLGQFFGGGIFAGFGLKDGGPVGFAGGGHVRGPGTSRSDSIPARLSRGEYVWDAATVRKHGALIEAIHRGSVPAFAAGGMVSPGALSQPVRYGSSGRQGPMMQVAVVSRFDADGNFETAVERVSRPIAQSESQKASAQVARKLPAAVDAARDARETRRVRTPVF